MRYICVYYSFGDLPSIYMQYLVLLFHPATARNLKRGTLLSSLILFEKLFTSFCWISSFVLNEHSGNFCNLKLILSFAVLLVCWWRSCLTTLWAWNFFDEISLTRSKLVKANAGENIERPHGWRPQTWIGKKVSGGQNITKKSSQREVGQKSSLF